MCWRRLQRQQTQRALQEAGNHYVPVFDAATGLIEESPSKAPVCGVAYVPTRCKLKIENAHENEVASIQWSPSGKRFATGGPDRKIKMWEMVEGKQELKCSLGGSNQSVTSLCWDADETQLMGSSNDFAIRIWTVADQRCRNTLTGHSGKVLSAKFYSGASQVVSGSHDRTVKLWDLRSRRCVKTFFAGSSCNDVAACQDYGLMISGHFDKKLRFWTTQSDRPTNEILLQGKITSLDLSTDSQYLLCCTRNDTLELIDLRTNGILYTYGGETFRVGFDYTRAVFSPDMQFCAAGSADGHLFVWNVNSTKIEKILHTKGHEIGITACSWHPGGMGILSCDRHRTVCYWSDY